VVTRVMLTGAERNVGDALVNGAGKGKRSGRTVPLNKELRAALVALKATRNFEADDPVSFAASVTRACRPAHREEGRGRADPALLQPGSRDVHGRTGVLRGTRAEGLGAQSRRSAIIHAWACDMEPRTLADNSVHLPSSPRHPLPRTPPDMTREDPVASEAKGAALFKRCEERCRHRNDGTRRV
jgi:hypothetical protein